jgi:hypothetical protein
MVPKPTRATAQKATPPPHPSPRPPPPPLGGQTGGPACIHTCRHPHMHTSIPSQPHTPVNINGNRVSQSRHVRLLPRPFPWAEGRAGGHTSTHPYVHTSVCPYIHTSTQEYIQTHKVPCGRSPSRCRFRLLFRSVAQNHPPAGSKNKLGIAPEMEPNVGPKMGPLLVPKMGPASTKLHNGGPMFATKSGPRLGPLSGRILVRECTRNRSGNVKRRQTHGTQTHPRDRPKSDSPPHPSPRPPPPRWAGRRAGRHASIHADTHTCIHPYLRSHTHPSISTEIASHSRWPSVSPAVSGSIFGTMFGPKSCGR